MTLEEGAEQGDATRGPHEVPVSEVPVSEVPVSEVPVSEVPVSEVPVDHRVAGEAEGDDWDALLAQLSAEPPEEGWVTLDEASQAAGVARSTLRAWYRTGQVPSRMVNGLHGPQRLVPLDAVLDRAFRSSRARRQLDRSRSLEEQIASLRRRLDRVERLLGLGGP